MNRKNILIGCFTLSLLLHLVTLTLFQRYSLWFSSYDSPDRKTDWLSFVDKKDRNEILKTSFESPEKEKKIEQIFKFEAEIQETPPIRLADQKFDKQPDFPVPFLFESPVTFSVNEPLIKKIILPSFTLPQQSSVNLLEHLPSDLIIPIPEKKHPNLFVPFPTQSNIALNVKRSSSPLEVATEPVTYTHFLDKTLTETPHVGKVPPMIPMPDLPKLPTLLELETTSYSESFEADLVFLPKDTGEGYIFALTLIPRQELNLPRFRQHITFLLDRSNTIQQKRLNATKMAIHKGFEYLTPEDTFNIIAFDSKIEKMSPYSLPCTNQFFIQAEQFLEKISLGSFFSTSNIYRPLFLTVPGKVEEDEIHTAILLTDGETLTNKSVTKSLLYDWTQYNNGRVSLFALGVEDNNSSTLETIAAFNKGKLFSTTTLRGFKRKLHKLLKTIQNPVAKNLVSVAISKSLHSTLTHLEAPG